MMTTVGPGLLGGITLGTWRRLLADRELKPDASCLPRAAAITLQSLRNSLLAALERRRFDVAVQRTVLKPPLFILGHWRSGTTHLHELLTKDPRFGFPNGYQTCFPHTFLTAERFDRAWMSAFLPAERPMDNMKWGLWSPQEDEFALGAATLCSPCLAWVFPRQRQRFEQYLTFRHASQKDLARWGAALLGFVRKVQWRGGRPLVLKSPPHTARIRFLLELFPEAKFVHIHREPYRVFQSSRRTLSILLDWHRLQRRDGIAIDEWVLRQYRAMYDAFFEDRPLIPSANYYEIAFEELEQNPLREVEKLYQALGLSEFGVCEPALRRYLDSLRDYHKNTFSELPKALAERIGSEWARCFEAWGYNRR